MRIPTHVHDLSLRFIRSYTLLLLQKQVLREQISRCTSKLSRTTGLIQFCIEALKEPDPATYLQVRVSWTIPSPLMLAFQFI